MQIDRHLNFVIPILRDDGSTAYVHAAPIGKQVFETYFLVIAKTFSQIYAEGLQTLAGPRVAGLMLKKIATEQGQWEAVERGLVNEIRRLANVVALTSKGWTTFPFQEAIDQKFFLEDDISEVENALTFFTVASAMHRRNVLEVILSAAGELWTAQTTSSTLTEFTTSLTTSSGGESTGERATPSSIPR